MRLWTKYGFFDVVRVDVGMLRVGSYRVEQITAVLMLLTHNIPIQHAPDEEYPHFMCIPDAIWCDCYTQMVAEL